MSLSNNKQQDKKSNSLSDILNITMNWVFNNPNPTLINPTLTNPNLTNPNPTLIKISGTIGLTILFNKSLNKRIYLFFDDHSNKSYCSNNLFLTDIYELLENKYSNLILLLEEPLISENTKLLSLCTDSTHIIKFRKFYTKSIKKCSLRN